jgi:oligopeptide transport system ATP-binding protein
MTKPILEVENIKKYFPITGGVFGKKIGEMKAVDGLTFHVEEGETLGIVGESGCGKSTTGRMLLRLIEPTVGKILFDNQDLLALPAKEMRKVRRNIQMIFQDPYASLNPRHTVEKILEEPLIVHGIGKSSERKKKVREMLEVVGLSAYHAKRYPHQFSGGQRQRIGIARALMTNPKLIIADEPVSALDVSIQSQVLNLLKDLQKEFHLTYIFIAHDLGVVRHISDRVAVMYKGRMVELAESEQIYQNPMHPYTQQLLSAVPIPDPEYYKAGEKEAIKYRALPSQYFIDDAWGDVDADRAHLVEVEQGHFVACHLK